MKQYIVKLNAGVSIITTDEKRALEQVRRLKALGKLTNGMWEISVEEKDIE